MAVAIALGVGSLAMGLMGSVSSAQGQAVGSKAAY